jgi:hypothetical protein
LLGKEEYDSTRNGDTKAVMNDDPNTIVLEYSTECEECGTQIPKGERAYLCPVTQLTLCLGGEGCGERARDSAKQN